MTDSLYLGRFQQGSEIAFVLQCTDAAGSPDDPTYLPWVQIWQDERNDNGTTDPDDIEAPITLISSQQIPADLRGVEDGVFRLPHFLGSLYAVKGRYIAIFKWLDSDGIAQTRAASFHVLPGGSADGSVISMFFSNRANAAYLVFQCDSGRLIRKPNPR